MKTDKKTAGKIKAMNFSEGAQLRKATTELFSGCFVNTRKEYATHKKAELREKETKKPLCITDSNKALFDWMTTPENQKPPKPTPPTIFPPEEMEKLRDHKKRFKDEQYKALAHFKDAYVDVREYLYDEKITLEEYEGPNGEIEIKIYRTDGTEIKLERK